MLIEMLTAKALKQDIQVRVGINILRVSEWNFLVGTILMYTVYHFRETSPRILRGIVIAHT